MNLRETFLLVTFAVVACTSTPGTPPDDAGSDVAGKTPDVQTPDVQTPDVQRPDVQTPDVQIPDVQTPDVQTPDVQTPDVQRPDVPVDTGAGCTGTAPLCGTGEVGGICGDVVTSSTCVERRWTCPRGMIPLSECRCVGRPPGRDCTCGATGWVCGSPDAGAPDTGVSTCRGEAPSCVSGTPGGTCSDALTVAACVRGTWTCMGDMILTSLCRCLGRPPGRDCTCGATGWVCGSTDAGALLNCNPATVRCRMLPPECRGGGEVPSVEGDCWGPCVVYTRCAPISCDPAAPVSQCPTNLVCYRTTRMCGPFL